MMRPVTRLRWAAVLVWLVCGAAFAQSTSSSPTQSSAGGSGSDAAQTFVSPLGLGTGATVSVTQKGTGVSAALDKQSPEGFVNFWQAGFSGTVNTNGQATVYSSSDSDAPGFKGKVGLGRSSFQATDTQAYTAATEKFKAVAWCMDVARKIAGLPNTALPNTQDSSCAPSITRAIQALKSADLDLAFKRQVLSLLQQHLSDEAKVVKDVCQLLKDKKSDAYQLCADSGGTQKSAEDQHSRYPAAYEQIVGAAVLPAFYYKVSMNWSPTLTSADYRAAVPGGYDLVTDHHWTGFLNAAALDASMYYKAWSAGLEASYGRTVNITTQNICSTVTSGTSTAQKCQTAMLGEPAPKSTFGATAAVSYTPPPFVLTSSLYRPGLELVETYEKPSEGGGHKTQVSIPLFVTPSGSPLKVVIGIQPTWIWNTEPKQTNDFIVYLFVGARPSVPE
jgi:hypothetical protein